MMTKKYCSEVAAALLKKNMEGLYTVQYVSCKKKFATFPSLAGMSLIKPSLAGNNLIIPGQGEFG
jgi:hypothetical protein